MQDNGAPGEAVLPEDHGRLGVPRTDRWDLVGKLRQYLAGTGRVMVVGMFALQLASSRGATAPIVVNDLDGDGRSDVIMAREGAAWLRSDVGREGAEWVRLPFKIPPGLGFEVIEAGDLDGDGSLDLILASPSLDLVLVFPGLKSASGGRHGRIQGVPGGVHAVAWMPTGHGLSEEALLLALGVPEPYVARIGGEALRIDGPETRSRQESESPVAASRFGISIDGYGAAGVQDLVAGPLGIDGGSALAFLWRSAENAPSEILFAELDGPSAVPLKPVRRKWPDITLKRGYAQVELGFGAEGASDPVLLAWRPGAPELAVIVLRRDGAVTVVESEMGADGFAVGQVRRWAGDAGDRWLVQDQSGARCIMCRIGIEGRLEVEAVLTPPTGQRFESVFGLADGGVAVTLGGANGTGKTLAAEWLGAYRNISGSWSLEFTTALPSPVRRLSRSGILVYDRDPFLDSAARELELLEVGDWAREASIGVGGVSVATEVFKGDRSGLGRAESREIKTAQALTAKAFVMANQWRVDASVYFGVPTRNEGMNPEVATGLSKEVDSDRDGMGDAWERLCFGGLEVGAQDDRDGDGFGALEEYRSATDPNDERSRPSTSPEPTVVEVVQLKLDANGRVTLRWQGPKTMAYRVESSGDLIRWEAASGAVSSVGSEWEWREAGMAGDARFFRVRGETPVPFRTAHGP